MKIGIVGNGVVGSATGKVFAEGHDVRVYDKDPGRCSNRLADVLASDLVFVCLPTPQQADSLECDLSVLEDFFALATPHADYVLRSTVPIGTTRRLGAKYGLRGIVHSPEFLTARTADQDAANPPQLLVGSRCYREGNSIAADETACRLATLYRERFPGVPIRYMDCEETEAVKLFLNGFFAAKVAYFNEINTLAERLGLDWEIVVSAMIADGRVGGEHTRVPGPDGRYGFGGACLPKDLMSLVTHYWKHRVVGGAPVCLAALQRNPSDRNRYTE